MKKKLMTIAKQLSDDDIQEILRLKRSSDKRVVSLRKKREKAAAALAKIDAELAALDGQPAVRRTRGRPKAAAASEKKPAKKAAKKVVKKVVKRTATKKPAAAKAGGRRKQNITAAVRDVFKRMGQPLRARDVVDGLSESGVKVKNVADMRKRVSVILASQKNSFEQLDRGVYQLKAE